MLYLFTVCTGLLGSLLGVWVSLELSNVFVVVLGILTGSRASAALEYFFVQALASLALVSGFIISLPVCIWGGLMLKLGLFPCFSWVFRVIFGFNVFLGFVIILGLQKMVPLLLVWVGCEFGCVSVVSLLCCLSMLSGVVLMAYSGDLKCLMVSSSFIHTSWVLLLMVWGVTYWVLYLLCYLLLISFLSFSVHYNWGWFTGGLVMSFSAIPPLFGFIVKVVSGLAVSGYYWFYVLVFLLVGGVSVCWYSKIFFVLFMTPSSDVGVWGVLMGSVLVMILGWVSVVLI
nr:NADH dehydrogenase subunit 2 [Pseudoacanthocephalus sp.]